MSGAPQAGSLPDERHARIAARLVWLILPAAAVSPLLAVRFPPLYDYYHWVFEGNLVAALLDPSAPAHAAVARHHAFVHLPIPNLLGPCGMALFAMWLPPLVAGRAFAALCVILHAVGFGALVRTVQGRPTLAEFLGFPWALGYYLYKGYLGQLGALGLLFVALAFLHRTSRAGTAPPPLHAALTLGAGATLLYLSHIMAWAMFAFVLFGYAIAVGRRHGRRAGLVLAATLAPSAPLLAWYVAAQQSQHAFNLYRSPLEKLEAVFGPLSLFLRTDPLPPAFPVLGANLLVLAAVVALVVVSLERGREPQAHGRLPVRLGLLLAALALALPCRSVGSMARPEARLILPALGLAAAGLAYRRLTTGRATAVGILVLAVAAAHVHEYRRADVSFHAVEAALVRSLPAGTPVLSLALAAPEIGPGCEQGAPPSIGFPSLKWFGLVWLMKTAGTEADLMGTSLLGWSGDPVPPFGLVTSTQHRWQIPSFTRRAATYARNYPRVLLFGCPADLRAAEVALSSHFVEADAGLGFSILRRRDAL